MGETLAAASEHECNAGQMRSNKEKVIYDGWETERIKNKHKGT